MFDTIQTTKGSLFKKQTIKGCYMLTATKICLVTFLALAQTAFCMKTSEEVVIHHSQSEMTEINSETDLEPFLGKVIAFCEDKTKQDIVYAYVDTKQVTRIIPPVLGNLTRVI